MEVDAGAFKRRLRFNDGFHSSNGHGYLFLKCIVRVRMSPLYRAVLDFSRAQLAKSSRRPVVIGIQGPQGAGKTTLTRALLQELGGQAPEFGVRPLNDGVRPFNDGVRPLAVTAVSIDDFYKTRAEQLAVSAANPLNPYLEHRGYPGTHDISLGTRTLRELRAGKAAHVPVYDKSAHGGRGDRAPESEWRLIPDPLDIVFIEGWMLGFEPVADSAISDPNLRAVNARLADYAAWYAEIDAWVILRAHDPEYVLTWRVEAEEKMKAAGKPGLSRADIEDYIRRFLPAYRTWGGAPANVPPERQLTLTIGLDRELT
jgi:D-glycerate 3-kinase